MSIEKINELANGIMVARLELKALEEEKLKLTEDVDAKIEILKSTKKGLEIELMDKMRENKLKSWKTEQANYARAVRKSVVLDPIVKKQIEDKVKKGETVENWELKETEYISIRINK